jgi:hypothetical protein
MTSGLCHFARTIRGSSCTLICPVATSHQKLCLLEATDYALSGAVAQSHFPLSPALIGFHHHGISAFDVAQTKREAHD